MLYADGNDNERKHVKWKELKVNFYKNHKYVILGVYSDQSYVRYQDTEYTDSIETKVEIYKDDKLIHEFTWFDYHNKYESWENQKFLIRFRLIKKYDWWRFAPKVTGLLNIEDDYYRALYEWSKYCERKIDSLLKIDDKLIYEQEMTDGLPESVFIKYRY